MSASENAAASEARPAVESGAPRGPEADERERRARAVQLAAWNLLWDRLLGVRAEHGRRIA